MKDDALKTPAPNPSLDWTPHFIVDGPAPADALRSHAPLANALARTVRAGRIRLVGVLGDWGSGKSTVIGLLQKVFKENDADRIACFTFDAWQHQSDPQRRAFLENLVDAIEIEPLFADLTGEIKGWRNRIETLNKVREETNLKTTPQVQPGVAMFAFSLLCLPIGVKLIGDGSLSVEDGHDLAATILFWVGWLVCAMPFVLLAIFGIHKRDELGTAPVWRLMANRLPESREELRIRDPEPSAIEFRKLFRDIVGAAQARNRRLVVIVDNLDRLPAEEALKVWAAVRAIFLGADGNRSENDVGSPTVIMPLDQTAVGKLHIGKDDQPDLVAVRSFLDKTFDIIFHVPPPVVSRRHAYLGARLREVFGDRIDGAASHVIGSVLERQLVELRETPSPRQINSFVNALAVLAMQRGDEGIPLTLMAVFVLRRTEIAQDVRNFAQVHQEYLATLHDNWRNHLAALHYGVPLDLAQEIFVDEPFREAIHRRDGADFAEFASMDGFDRVFLRNIDSALTREAALRPFAAAELLAGLHLDDPWLEEAWAKLRELAGRTPPEEPFNREDVAGLAALVEAYPADRRIGYIEQMSRALGSGLTASTEEGARAFGEAAERLSALATAVGDAEIEFPVPHGFDGWSAVLVLDLNPELVRRFRLQASDPNLLASHLAERLAGPTAHEGPSIPHVVRAMCARGLNIDWTPLISAVDLRMSGGADSSGRLAAHTAHALMASSPSARESWELLGRDSAYDRMFADFWHEGPEEDIAVLTAIQFARGGGLPILRGSWEERLDQSFELVDRIHDRMAEVGLGDDLAWLTSRLHDHPGDATLLARLTYRRFVDDEPDWGAVFANPLALIDLLPTAAQAGFWKRALDETAAEGLVATAQIDVVSRVLAHAQAADADSDLGPWVEAALINRPPNLIAQAIESGEEPYPLIEAEARRRQLRNRLTALVAEALESTLPRMLQGTPEGRARWFALESSVSTARRSGLRRQLLRRLVQVPLTSAQLLNLFTYAGDSITRSRFLSGRPDEAVPRIILPLVNDEAGRQWLIGNALLLQSWLTAASPPVKQRVIRQLRLRAQQGLRSARRLLELLQNSVT